MSTETGIAWTDHTFNPWWGCQRVSPGCEHCYAEAWDARFGGEHWGAASGRRFFGETHWQEPRKWHAAAVRTGEPARVFCASMADVFEDRRDLDAWRIRLWWMMEELYQLHWQVLTKRPENIRRLFSPIFLERPQEHIWLGTSVEDRARRERIDVLREVPAKVRFLSVEPLLEDLGLLDLRGIHWVIVGGESGTGCRPMDERWAWNIVQQCKSAGVACFVKQLGGARDKRAEPAFWPAHLRVREFPMSAAYPPKAVPK